MNPFGDFEARDLGAAWKRLFEHFMAPFEDGDDGAQPWMGAVPAEGLMFSLTSERGPRTVPWVEAERELLVVHSREQSDLLAEASRIKVTLRTSRRVLLGSRSSAHTLADWRARVREELRFARADRVDVPLALAVIARRPPSCWPDARDLAFSALALAPTRASRLAFVAAWLAAADPARALDELALDCPGTDTRDTALLRAAASDLRCELDPTSRHLADALDTADGPYAAGLLAGLALLRGETARARAALARIELAPEAATADGLRDLAARLPGWRRHCPGELPEPSARLLFELLCSLDSRLRRIGFLMIEGAH